MSPSSAKELLIMNSPKLRFKNFNDEWISKKLGDICQFLKGGNLSKNDLSINGSECILYGELYTKYKEIILKITSKTNSTNLIFGLKNDILMPSSGETAIDIATASCLQLDNIALGGDINILRPYQNNGIFISYSINGVNKHKIAKLSQGIQVVHMYNDILKNVYINFPSLEEQTKIANFLSLIDRKIELQEKLVENLKLYKKGLLQKVFSNNHGWKKVKIGSCITQISNRNKNNIDYDVLSVSNLKGFIKQTEQFNDRELASENKSNYKVVDKYEFAYNPARINVGSIAMLEKFNCGIVSPMYVCFKCNNIYHSFLKYFFLTNEFKNQMKMRLEGSVRMCLSYEALSNINIKIPSIEEQNRIANLFSNLDKKMDFETKKLQDLKTYKKGLLQKMFI